MWKAWDAEDPAAADEICRRTRRRPRRLDAGAGAAHASGVWDDLAACESGGDWSINTGNGYYGGLQFSGSTWLSYGGGESASRADQASRDVEIAVRRAGPQRRRVQRLAELRGNLGLL